MTADAEGRVRSATTDSVVDTRQGYAILLATAHMLSKLTAMIAWPAGGLADLQRTYELRIPAWDVTALVEAGVAVDPLLKPVGEALRSPASELVGRVVDQRFEVYISGRQASGLGLVGTVEEQPAGSRVTTKVGWVGPARWLPPAFNLVAVIAVVGLASRVVQSESTLAAWASFALGACVAGAHATSMIARARRARNDEVPALYQRLDALLASPRR